MGLWGLGSLWWLRLPQSYVLNIAGSLVALDLRVLTDEEPRCGVKLVPRTLNSKPEALSPKA